MADENLSLAEQYKRATDPTTKKEDLFQPEVVEIVDDSGMEDEIEITESEKPTEVVAETNVEDKIEEKVEDVVEEKDEIDTLLSEFNVDNNIEDKKPEAVTSDSSLKIEDIIKEKSGGAFSSLEELIERATKSQFASERIKKLNDLEASGKDIMKVLEYEKMNIENLDPANHNHALELIKSKMIADDPTITERELNYILRDYTYNEDSDSEDEIELKKVKALREAKKAKVDLIKIKTDFSIPDVKPMSNGVDQSKELERIQKEWEDQVEKEPSLLNYKTEKINVGDKTLDFVVKDDVRRSIVDIAKRPNDLWKEYTNSSGAIDFERLASDMIQIKQKEAIRKTIWDQGVAHGAREFAAKLKNSRQRGETQPVSTFIPEGKQIYQQYKQQNK